MARPFDRLDRRETAIYREPNAPSKLIVPTLDLAENSLGLARELLAN
jgi:hypothetical protein